MLSIQCDSLVRPRTRNPVDCRKNPAWLREKLLQLRNDADLTDG